VTHPIFQASLQRFGFAKNRVPIVLDKVEHSKVLGVSDQTNQDQQPLRFLLDCDVEALKKNWLKKSPMLAVFSYEKLWW